MNAPCDEQKGTREQHLVSWNALVHQVISELALDGTWHAPVLAAFICDDLLKPNLLPVCCHSRRAIWQNRPAFALSNRTPEI
jgi:hypothetical protein